LKKFKIGDYLVDVQRNQLTISGRTILVEPKVMDVLHHLALNQGEVVSQQELFDAIWPNSLFSSGSVLRCIAQLRKALGDDAKNQSVIHTHPKRGYSLTLNVEMLSSSHEGEKDKHIGSSSVKTLLSKSHFFVNKKPKKLFYLLIFLIIFTGGGIHLLKNKNSPMVKSQFSELTPITSTGAIESLPKFSPNEDSIAFIRTDRSSRTHLWLKSLETKQEYQLSKGSKEFLSFVWSNEGREIAYLSKTNTGYEIGYFTLPIAKTQSPIEKVLYRFQSNAYAGAIQWGNNNDLYYLLYPKDDLVNTKAEVYLFNMKTKVPQLFWQQNDDFSPYDMSLAPNNNSLALSGYERSFMTAIKVMSLKDKTILPVTSELPTYTEVSWHPSEEYLLLTDFKEVKLLSLQGEITKINWLNSNDMENASFDNDGVRVALALSMADVDIVLQSASDKNEVTSISNSNSIDTNARFSPSGSTIVYLSDQAGYQQVFQNKSGVKQLFFANSAKEVINSPPIWSADGKRVLINTSSQLFMVDAHTLEKSVISNDTNFLYAYEWYQNEHALLVDYKVDDGLMLAKYDLNSLMLTPLASGNIHYAHLAQGNVLIVIKNNKIVKITENQEVIVFEPKGNQKIVASVSVDNGLLFQLNSIREDSIGIKELWHINTLDNKLIYIAEVPSSFDKITDATSDGNERLFITPVQQKKDIMLLQ
jgi:DNA-binding winged helix-turn-helix (wHTH) protein/Tol biopolymer transport system component